MNPNYFTLKSLLFEAQEVVLTPQQTEKVGSALASLGIETKFDTADSQERVMEDANASEPNIDLGKVTKGILRTQKGEGPANDSPLNDPRFKEKEDRIRKNQEKGMAIPQEGIELAKKFFVAGEAGKRWYYNASQILKDGIPDEQNRNLFALLLAATSVQNEILGNFVEASALYNAIQHDLRYNFDLLSRWLEDRNMWSMANADDDEDGPGATEYKNLELYRVAAQIKMTYLPAKFGNVAKAIDLLIRNQLTEDNVVDVISRSVNYTEGGSFNTRDPKFRKMKIANYALTLIDPEYASAEDNPFNVVVDTWMLRAFYPGVPKERIDYLMGSEVAYANVADAVSELAAEAGVSPHEMQAAIWLGIKQQVEGDSGGASDYLQAIDVLVDQYFAFWKETEGEVSRLMQVIKALEAPIAAEVLRANRSKHILRIVDRNREKRKQAKAAMGNEPISETTVRLASIFH